MAKRTRASARRTSVRASKKTPAAKPRRRPGALSSKGRGAARQGGPAPGTPSPTRTRMTPELQAHVKRLYEETDQPICQIALDVGVDESVIRRMGPREGWVRHVPPARGLPPLATLLAEVEALEKGTLAKPPTPDPSPPLASLAGGGERAESAAEGTSEENIARFIRIVMAHLDEFEAVRRDGKLLPKHHLQTARAISILTEAFNKLQRLRASSTGSIHDDLANMPADLDAFRDELARQVDAFIASRADTAAHGLGDAVPADDAAAGLHHAGA